MNADELGGKTLPRRDEEISELGNMLTKIELHNDYKCMKRNFWPNLHSVTIRNLAIPTWQPS